ncbi:hypothetical protein CC86DRAFT_118206 [Ophiobolus disseminans]|uniref:Uncharacterized protein n=1 Tax=Ophiobolus disseminans TaxID=1469910 RepID=A0A6A6ZGN3_9PLEO|nr:hypothetical protein CC86DRAFT_118206 [Ophiobolus disseminans]
MHAGPTPHLARSQLPLLLTLSAATTLSTSAAVFRLLLLLSASFVTTNRFITVPWDPCTLAGWIPGPPRYDSLTVSYGPPPSSESFVRSSVTLEPTTPHQTPEPL